ncbi:uncharacterized protein LOC111692948, partial [Anoplophora glabripennis]|uniref:uncharacterized protein LOC111692948 n=1 Tax=Anoplophora glabripennis TaxID=217634 RepID=UPI000C77B10B
MALPHIKTISKWYRSIGGTPGFTNEALAAIKMKVRETNSEILGNLVFDETFIMQSVERNGKRCTGYVDVGIEVYGDNIPEVTKALVFMVVAINSHWKIPV